MSKLALCLRTLCALMVATSAIAQTNPKDLPDSDGDGTPDLLDNCVKVPNRDQKDSNQNGIGDACDGDINGDGKVNAIDLALLKQSYGKAGTTADLNGDGKVDARDLALLRTRYGMLPGPTGLPLKTSFVSQPPLAREVEVMLFDKDLPDGRNALLRMDLNGGMPDDPKGEATKTPDRLVLHTETGIAALNDLGLFGDDKAGDGILSAVVRYDRDRNERDLKAYISRVNQKGLKQAPLFNLRELAKVADFDVRNPLVGGGERRQFTFELPQFGSITRVLIPFPHLPLAIPPSTDPAKTLMITDLGVVQDPARSFSPCQPNGVIAPFGNPNGPWSFKTLMGNMAGPAGNPQQFVHDWLNQWRGGAGAGTVRHSDGITVAFPVPARPALVNVISSLQGAAWNPANPATLNLDRLPFRLLAIVNRLDLAQASFYGPGSPGELRFVFGLVEKQGNQCVASASQMTVILEYKLPNANCLGLKNLANQWTALDALVPGSAPYNAALQSLTSDVTPINASPSRINGSAIGQVRTNEVKLGFPWELREFTLQTSAGSPVLGQLRHETVKNTPDASFNHTNRINQAIAGGGVTRQVGGFDFVASANRYGPGAFPANPPWDGNPALAPASRHNFSLNTCGGCHFNETGTQFTMVHSNGPLNAPAGLADFLTGAAMPKADPVHFPPLTHHFNDLNRRAVMLDQMAAKSCFFLPHLPVLALPELIKLPIPELRLPSLSVFSPPFAH